MDGLIVRQPFADLIADGLKVWELRRSPLRLSGRFYILAASRPHPAFPDYPPTRLAVAVGTAIQTRIIGPLSVAELARWKRRHRTTPEGIDRYSDGKPLYAMELVAKKLKRPRRYRIKPGAVTIVRDVELL